jgi:hypothetical protein
MVKRLSACLGTVLVATVMIALGAPSTSWSASQTTGHANSRGALRLHFGRAGLDAPAGALPDHAEVTIRRQPSSFGVATAGTYVFSVRGGNLRRPATLTLPLTAAYVPGSLFALAYRGTHGAWYTAPARVNNNGRTATARISHLSTWTGIDLEAYVLAQIEAALQPAAVASSSSSCSHADPLVSVAGAGPLQVCISKPYSSRVSEEVILFDPTKTAFSIANCTGGLSAQCTESLIDNGYLGVLGVGNHFTIPYNATAATSSLTYTPNVAGTVTDNFVSVVGDLFTDGGTFVASVAPCVQQHKPSSLVAGFVDAIVCIFEVGLGPVDIGPIHFGGIGKSAEEGVLKDAAAKAAQKQTLDAGGVITLTSQQELPAVGGSGTPQPPTTPTAPTTPTNPTTPTTPTNPPTPTSYAYHVYGTCADGACGLNIRSGPGYSEFALVGSLPEGAEADVVCQAVGQTVGPSPATGNSSAIWDKLTDGYWVSDLYLTTPNVGTWSPPIPQC